MFVGFRGTISVTAYDQSVDDLKADHRFETIPIDPLSVGADLDDGNFPSLLRDHFDEVGKLPVQQGLSEVEETEGMNPFHVDMSQAEGKIIHSDLPDLRLKRRVRATQAAKGATMDDVEMDGKEMAGLMDHVPVYRIEISLPLFCP